MRVAVTSLLVQLLLLLLGVSSTRGVLFPVNTVIQIVAAISWPIEIPDRKLFMNTGFQFNYNLANQLSTFYKPAFFPYSRALLDIVAGADTPTINATATTTMATGTVGASASDDGAGVDRGRRRSRSTAGDDDAAATRSSPHSDSASPFVGAASDGGGAPHRRHPLNVDKYMLAHQQRHGQVDGCDVHRRQQHDCAGESIDDKPPHVVSQDMSAGELYRSFEDTLHESGFHRSCLAKSVCEMAHHPMHNYRKAGDGAGDDDADAEDLMADVLHFVLTPSKHRSFQHHEKADRMRYEDAEALGRMGGDCERAYGDCERSLLDYVSVLDGEHDNGME